MAVTVQTTPAAYTPAYNPQWFVATSTQTAQPNFRYRVVLTDVISSATVTKDVDKNSAGYFVFDVSSFSEQYITQLNPSGLYGFQANTGAIREIRVNIGEVYGTIPAYTAGANNTFYVWNASLDLLTMQSYAYTDYVYDRATGNIKYLMSIPKNSAWYFGDAVTPFTNNNGQNYKTWSGKSDYIYCLAAIYSTSYNFQTIQIIGYDSAGTQLSSTIITNPSIFTTYTSNYNFIDVGYDGLANMAGTGQITAGTNPIPVSTFAYYDVLEYTTSAPPNNDLVKIKRFYVECEPRYDVIGVHFLAPKGEFETQICSKLSLRTSDITKSTYSKLPYSLTGYVVGYTYGSAVDNTLTSTVRNKISVNTDWLTEAEMTMLRDAVASPIVYVDLGDTGGFVSMKITNNSFVEKRKYNEQLLSASFDLEYTHINTRQRG